MDSPTPPFLEEQSCVIAGFNDQWSARVKNILHPAAYEVLQRSSITGEVVESAFDASEALQQDASRTFASLTQVRQHADTQSSAYSNWTCTGWTSPAAPAGMITR